MRRRPPSLTLGSCSRRRKRQTVLSETPSFRAASAGVSHRAAIESIPINPVKPDQARALARHVDHERRIELREARCSVPVSAEVAHFPCQGAGRGGTVAGA